MTGKGSDDLNGLTTKLFIFLLQKLSEEEKKEILQILKNEKQIPKT